MSSLFRSLNNFSTKRENAVKEALVSTLGENCREIEYEAKERGRDNLELCETTSTLCITLEAIFLHGLKDSFLWQTINAIAGDEERRPEPSFWSPLLVFLHKQVIEQIQSLSQITSEIGQCRAWIRLSLNECLFSSYLNNIRKNASALSPYYKRFALLKDGACLEMVAKLMQDIESHVQFNMPVNSSLLNQWPDYSLQLSGLWTPPLKSCPISSGVDVASDIMVETAALPTPQPLRTNELFAESISNSPFSRGTNFPVQDLNEHENLDLFLIKVDEMEIIDEETNAEGAKQSVADSHATHEAGAVDEIKPKGRKKRKASKGHETTAEIRDTIAEVTNSDSATSSSNSRHSLPADLSLNLHGNSLSNLMQSSWSSEVAEENDTVLRPHELQRSVSTTSSRRSTLSSPLEDRGTYNGLLRRHERNRQVGWTEVWDKFLLQNTVSALGFTPPGGDIGEAIADNADGDSGVGQDGADTEQDSLERSSNANSDFEFVPQSGLEKFNIVELQEMVEQLCKLAREPGLDAQGFLCKSCQHPLGIGYCKFQVCSFSGNYFCDNCMELEPTFIPAKIIYNWDFGTYTVSKRAASFLDEFRCQPIIDFMLLNPDIYNASETMADLQSLRIRLNFIRAYLYTCYPTSSEELKRQFFGRNYLYEHIHQYSISDLANIQRGTLQQQLQKAYKKGEAHVRKCTLCSMKGFHCEICKGPRVLYPFHIDTTYRCELCGSVFHANCLNEQQPCPKCERKRKRENVSPHETDNLDEP